jgi:hypothetical protein
MAKEQFNIFRVARTGILAVDMCAACIRHYRAFRKPLKTIYLSKRLFHQFRDWVALHVGMENALASRYEFDSVHIELMADQGRMFEWGGYKSPELKVDFYETKRAEA